MSARIVLTDTTKLAIIEQWEYYAAKQDAALADRLEHAIGSAIESLRESSSRGMGCRLASRNLTSLRWIPVQGFPYRISLSST